MLTSEKCEADIYYWSGSSYEPLQEISPKHSFDYAQELDTKYKTWKDAYHNAYNEYEEEVVLEGTHTDFPKKYPDNGKIRKRYRKKVNDEEDKFKAAFYKWINSPLSDFRSHLEEPDVRKEIRTVTIVVDIRCEDPNDDQKRKKLERLPWETWQPFSRQEYQEVYILRSGKTKRVLPNHLPVDTGKKNILVISGENRQNKALRIDYEIIKNCVRDRANVESLVFPNSPESGRRYFLKDLQSNIDRHSYLDILVFAGHSEENENLNGVLQLSPFVKIPMADIEPILQKAVQEKGLHTVIFNSCSGLDLCKASLMNGVNQVIIMREVIYHGHNTRKTEESAALSFIDNLFSHLTEKNEYKNLKEAFWAARNLLKNQEDSFPSAYLIPSLYCSSLEVVDFFAFEPSLFKRIRKSYFLKRHEILKLTLVSLFLYLLTPLQEIFFDVRFLMQAAYKSYVLERVSNNPLDDHIPPVALIAVDYDSLQEAKVDARNYYPIDRKYLAQIVDQLKAKHTSVLGLDFLFVEPHEDDHYLRESLESIADNSWIILATRKDLDGKPLNISNTVRDSSWAIDASVDDWKAPFWEIDLNTSQGICEGYCHFSYLLVLAQKLQDPMYKGQFKQHASENSRSSVTGNLQASVNSFIQKSLESNTENYRNSIFYKISHPTFRRNPVIDFSISPKDVYSYVPARRLNDDKNLEDNGLGDSIDFENQIVIVAAGGYEQAEDTFSAPMAISFWRNRLQKDYPSSALLRKTFTGGEGLSYFVHHILHQHWLVILPLHMAVGITVVFGLSGKIFSVKSKIPLEPNKKHVLLIKPLIFCGLYTIFCIHAYSVFLIVIPIILPITAFWFLFFNYQKLLFIKR